MPVTEKVSATGLKFRVKNKVVQKHIKLVLETEYLLRFEGKIIQAEDDPAIRRDNKEPPYLASVIMLETGEEGNIICPHVLRKELDKHYPDDCYVGLCFRIVPHKLSTRRYNTYEIDEIESDGEIDPKVAAAHEARMAELQAVLDAKEAEAKEEKKAKK